MRPMCVLLAPQALGPRASAISTVCPSDPDLHRIQEARQGIPGLCFSSVLLLLMSHWEAHLCPQWCDVIPMIHLTVSSHCIIHDVISVCHLTVSSHCVISLYHQQSQPDSLTEDRWVLGKCSFTFLCFAFVACEKINIKYIDIIYCMNFFQIKHF